MGNLIGFEHAGGKSIFLLIWLKSFHYLMDALMHGLVLCLLLDCEGEIRFDLVDLASCTCELPVSLHVSWLVFHLSIYGPPVWFRVRLLVSRLRLNDHRKHFCLKLLGLVFARVHGFVQPSYVNDPLMNHILPLNFSCARGDESFLLLYMWNHLLALNRADFAVRVYLFLTRRSRFLKFLFSENEHLRL